MTGSEQSAIWEESHKRLSWHHWGLGRLELTPYGHCGLTPPPQSVPNTQQGLNTHQLKRREELIIEWSGPLDPGVSLPEKEAAAPDSGQLARFYSQDMVLLRAGLASTTRLLCSPVEQKQFHGTASDKATLWLMKTKTRWLSNHISTQTKCDHVPNHTKDQTSPTPANEWPPVL